MKTSVTKSTRPEFQAFTTSLDLYQILGVTNDASTDDIKRSYRRLSIVFHPDKHEEKDKQAATEIFQKISLAYHTLSDPARRSEYDLQVARGRASHFAEDARYEQIDPLAEILAQLHAQSDLFSYDHIHVLDADMRSFLEKNLERELGERVVGAVGISELPRGIEKPEGDFQSGSMVYTSLRIVFPFTMSWTETQGNTQITHTNLHLRGVTLPNIRRVVVIVKGRLNRTTRLKIEARDNTTYEIAPKSVNLARMFMLLTYWGIPIAQEELTSRVDDIKATVWAVPSAIGAVVAAVFAVAFVCGCCASSGDEPFVAVGVVAVLFFAGIGQILVVASAIGMAVGKAKAIREYERKHVRDFVEEET